MIDSLHGRRIAITGANSGIGLATAEALARRGAEVFLLCRDPARGDSARAQLARACTGRPPVVLPIDLSDPRSVRDAARQLDALPSLDVLINNAGAVFGRRELTPDGVERTFATNHLGPFLLTLLALPVLRRAGSARIVTVSSRVHAGRLDIDDLQGERGFSTMRAYAESKLANILVTYELARRLGPGPVTANCLAPGLVRSNFGRSLRGALGWMPKLLALTPLSITPQKGAQTSVYLAAAPEVATVTGTYFYRCRPAESKPVSRDRALAAALWTASAALVGLSPALP